MPDPRALVIFLVIILIPAFLIVTRQKKQLLAWICLTVCIDIFNTTLFINMQAARIAGLLLIPWTIKTVGKALRTTSGTALLLQHGYLILLGLLFGLFFPWSDGGMFVRSFNQLPLGRSVIYLIRRTADISIAFFVAEQVIRTKRPDLVLKYVMIGTSIAAIGGIAEFLTGIDLYGTITGLRPLSSSYRMRGFNHEPRGLGLIASHGVLLSILAYSHKRSLKNLSLILLHALAVLLTTSTFAIFTVLAGSVGLFLLDKRSRSIFVVLTIIVGLVAYLSFYTEFAWSAYWLRLVKLRLLDKRIDLLATNEIEKIVLRLNIFDSSALLFLMANPLYLVIGSGPGLVSIPATLYIPRRAIYRWLWNSEQGLNSPPSMGSILELSNTGLIGILLWAVFYISCMRAFNKLRKQANRESRLWAITGSAFGVTWIIYLVQASALSAIWPVFMGCGLAAGYLAFKAKVRSRSRSRSKSIR